MTITKRHITKKITEDTGIKIKESDDLLDSFLKKIINIGFKDSKIVKISNFGSFKNKKSPKRIGRNPKTKELYIIHPREKLIFHPSTRIREDIN